jgi:hypothetical protein
LDGRSFTWRDLEDVFALRFASCNKLYRKAFLDGRGIRYADDRFYEDMVFTYRCLFEAERLRLVRRELYLNRRQREEATTYEQGSRAVDAVAALEELATFLRSDPALRPLGGRFAAFRFQRLRGYLHKNDAQHMPPFYEALQAVARDPALIENPYLGAEAEAARVDLLRMDLQEFLIRELWLARTSEAKFRRRWEQARVHNARLKGRIDRSRLLFREERARMVYRRRFLPAVRFVQRRLRFVQRRLNAVRRRLPRSSAGQSIARRRNDELRDGSVTRPAGAVSGQRSSSPAPEGGADAISA